MTLDNTENAAFDVDALDLPYKLLFEGEQVVAPWMSIFSECGSP